MSRMASPILYCAGRKIVLPLRRSAGEGIRSVVQHTRKGVRLSKTLRSREFETHASNLWSRTKDFMVNFIFSDDKQ